MHSLRIIQFIRTIRKNIILLNFKYFQLFKLLHVYLGIILLLFTSKYNESYKVITRNLLILLCFDQR